MEVGPDITERDKLKKSDNFSALWNGILSYKKNEEDAPPIIWTFTDKQPAKKWIKILNSNFGKFCNVILFSIPNNVRSSFIKHTHRLTRKAKLKEL